MENNTDKSLSPLGETGQKTYDTSMYNFFSNLRDAAQKVAVIDENYGQNLADLINLTVGYAQGMRESKDSIYNYSSMQDAYDRKDAALNGTLWVDNHKYDEDGYPIPNASDNAHRFAVDTWRESKLMSDLSGGLDSFMDLYDVLPTKEEKLQAIKDAYSTFDAQRDEALDGWFTFLYKATEDPAWYYGQGWEDEYPNPYFDIANAHRDVIRKAKKYYGQQRRI